MTDNLFLTCLCVMQTCPGDSVGKLNHILLLFPRFVIHSLLCFNSLLDYLLSLLETCIRSFVYSVENKILYKTVGNVPCHIAFDQSVRATIFMCMYVYII